MKEELQCADVYVCDVYGLRAHAADRRAGGGQEVVMGRGAVRGSASVLWFLLLCVGVLARCGACWL